MTSGQTTCPYCNSQVSATSPLPVSRRLDCPRCGESFPYRGVDGEISEERVTEPVATSEPTEPQPPHRWSNGAVAGTVLAVMGAMLSITLTAALLTEHIRRAHDLTRPPRRQPFSFPVVLLIGSLVYFVFLILHLVRVLRGPSAPRTPGLRTATMLALTLLMSLALADVTLIVSKTSAMLGWPTRNPAAAEDQLPPVQTVKPAELEGLGYLPQGTNAVMAVHAAQAAQTPAGRAFLDRSQLAHSGIGLAEIYEAAGIPRDHIDHVVLGVRLDDSLLPAPVLVVRTRKPFDAVQVRSTLKARHHPGLGHKEVYDFELPRLKLNALLWCPNDRTLVVTIARKVMEKLPLTADSGAARLAPPLRDFLAKRMPAGVEAWAVGHWNDSDTAPVLLSSLVPPEDRKLLAAVRTFGLWLRIDESIVVNAAIECADAVGAEKLEQRLKQRAGSDFFKVLGSGDRADLVSRELARTLEVQREEKWVTLKAEADAKTVRKAVGGP